MAKKEIAPETEDAAVEKDRVVSGKTTNPTFIEWPFDEYGITSQLRREGVSAVSRVAGDPQKAEVLMQTLRCLAEHLHVRLPDQQDAISQQAEAHNTRENQSRALALADARRKAVRIKGELVVAEARVFDLEKQEVTEQ